MDAYMGMITAVGFSFAPQGWFTCSGQQLSISQNTALFSLLGTVYGGNGTTTFALPNLNGRAAIGTGQLPGGGNYQLGQVAGTESVTLNQSQLPLHTHTATFAGTGSTLKASSTDFATTVYPVANAVFARAVDVAPTPTSKPAIYAPAGTAVDTALAGLNVAGTVTVAPAGGSTPVSILNPYVALTMIICAQGIYPTRP